MGFNTSNAKVQKLIHALGYKAQGCMPKFVVRALSHAFSKDLILVIGCQRSGTTLMYLLLTSHPRITGLDEDEARFELPPALLPYFNGLFFKKSCYKLPEMTAYPCRLAKNNPGVRLIWMVRHPYMVVSSMRLLKFDQENWIQRFGRKELLRYARHFSPVKNLLDSEQLNDVEIGAYIWKFKIKMLKRYYRLGMNPLTVCYEDLLNYPIAMMKRVSRHAGVRWHDELVHPERHHQGKRHIGNTLGGQPIDRSRMWPPTELSDEEREKIYEICREEMAIFGYQGSLREKPDISRFL